MCFLLPKNNVYANFHRIRNKNKKVGVAIFCAKFHASIFNNFYEKCEEPQKRQKQYAFALL